MRFSPRPEQSVAVQHAIDFLVSAPPGAKQLYAGPTGVGKSIIELLVREGLRDRGFRPVIITPRDEIVAGMMDKLGLASDADPWEHDLWTPISLRNRLLDGRQSGITHLIFDETHHHEATSWQQLDLLTGLAPSVGYTASPYRGTPRSTRRFRETWGDPLWIITYEEAIAAGYIKMPTIEVVPLVDDDCVEVQGSEFVVESLESATLTRSADLAEHSRRFYDGELWDRPTIYSFPSTQCCIQFQKDCADRGLPTVVVNAETPKRTRYEIFDAVERRIVALLNIEVVSEGVDLKLERYVDASPTMSPVKWVQRFGRVMRPTTQGTPEYICTNRNILRHAYILEGCMPSSALVEAHRKFPPTDRAHTRVLGMEAIGRFKPTTTKLLDGTNLYVYNMSALIGTVVAEFACIVHPFKEPLWAVRVNGRDELTLERTWGTWKLCDAPEDLKGFGSKSQGAPSEKQMRWWTKSAARYGLDPEQEVNRKSFAALPVLSDIGGWPC